MSGIHVAGLGSDFTTDVNIQVMNAIKNGWPAGGAQGDSDLRAFDASTNPSGVRFGTTWWDGNHFYEVHVVPVQALVKPHTIGSSTWYYSDTHAVHVFAKGKSKIDKKWKMEKETQQQLLLLVGNPGGGISFWEVDEFREAPEPPGERTDWASELVHSVCLVTTYYEKVRAP